MPVSAPFLPFTKAQRERWRPGRAAAAGLPTGRCCWGPVLLASALLVSPLLPAARPAHAAPAARESYELRPLLHAEVAQDMQRCVGPQAGADQLQAFLAKALEELAEGDPTRAAQLATPGGAGVVLAAAGQWACVPLSGEGFPQWPLEAMHGLIVPVGVPAGLTRAWRRNLLAQVARDGVGRGLIVYPGGEADQVHVIAEQRQALQIKLSLRLLPAGSYREQHYSAVLRHPGLTRLVTRSSGTGLGTPWRMAIPPHRLLQAVQDGFVVVPPTAQTRSFVFAGTQWLLGGEAGPVTLQADGTVARSGGAEQVAGSRATGSISSPNSGPMSNPTSSPTSSPTFSPQTLGHWRVADGVLQLALIDGSRYALTLRDNPHTLMGMGRRADADGPEEEGGEAQWPAQMHRHGVQEAGPPPGLQARA